jgi:L-asparagine transporter-like permease
MWLFPWASFIAIGAMIGVLAAMALTPELSQELWVSMLTVALALAAFALMRAWRHSAATRAPQTD